MDSSQPAEVATEMEPRPIPTSHPRVPEGLEDVAKTGKMVMIPIGLGSLVFAGAGIVLAAAMYLIREIKTDVRNSTAAISALVARQSSFETGLDSVRQAISVKDNADRQNQTLILRYVDVKCGAPSASEATRAALQVSVPSK